MPQVSYTLTQFGNTFFLARNHVFPRPENNFGPSLARAAAAVPLPSAQISSESSCEIGDLLSLPIWSSSRTGRTALPRRRRNMTVRNSPQICASRLPGQRYIKADIGVNSQARIKRRSPFRIPTSSTSRQLDRTMYGLKRNPISQSTS